MLLLVETVETYEVQLLTEGTGAEKALYIAGVFAQAEKQNRNGRVYGKSIMERAVNEYNREFVTPKRALGELSHPENRPTVKPELASHLITEFKMVGNDVIGKARVLNTPQGQVVKGLLEGGVQLGVSTRGLGSIVERAGVTYVKDDFKMMAVDVVSDPSGIDCWVNAINENKQWIYIDGHYEERNIEESRKVINKSKRVNEAVLKQFQKFLRSIG